MDIVQTVKSFGGQQLRCFHSSVTLACDMHFSIYLPPNACVETPVPVIYWLSGLTCTDENFVQKAGAQRYAAQHNVAIVTADTSPRGENVPDDPQGEWDFGLGAGFYVDATQEPWCRNYNMYSYIVNELPKLVESEFPVSREKSIMGHSMGGHGALTIALRNPQMYQCVTAFSPICAPTRCPWGQKAFSLYLGQEQAFWQDYDASNLIKGVDKASKKIPIWIEQGEKDHFLDLQLKTPLFQKVCEEAEYPLTIHYREGYDHSYFFISSFIGEQVARHANKFQQK